ncbi:hypothetical protein [Mycobacterium angelicum]|uniref:Transmembrane protein n=1 Tax=Mycobacterium angelicum TaxID=470074 RepID=A0A1W9ZW82_MYCAN|nr:hypothetical protein [Mycobacterium angelicum]MCV7198323.1 hypothetical protein [Mycobacterium angelicum]ORA21925.1 hypothetical protein BST12_11010 [Mycobacterium angelicum]
MADADADKDRESNPGTEPFVPDFADIEDTGEQSVPFVPNWDDTGSQPIESAALQGLPGLAGPAQKPDDEPASETETAAAPVQVPGRYQYLKWWKFVLVLLGVWFFAGQIGLSLYYWWYHTIDKTAPVFVVLVYVVACTVGGLLISMVQGRPTITAMSIAVMTGPFASVAAAAPLYGYFYCERATRCLIGVLPY